MQHRCRRDTHIVILSPSLVWSIKKKSLSIKSLFKSDTSKLISEYALRLLHLFSHFSLENWCLNIVSINWCWMQQQKRLHAKFTPKCTSNGAQQYQYKQQWQQKVHDMMASRFKFRFYPFRVVNDINGGGDDGCNDTSSIV